MLMFTTTKKNDIFYPFRLIIEKQQQTRNIDVKYFVLPKLKSRESVDSIANFKIRTSSYKYI